MTPLPQHSPSPSAFETSQRGSATLGTVRLRPVAGRPRRETRDECPLTEDLFTAALGREFKRADRFDESFALLRISLPHGTETAVWNEVVHILNATKSDADAVGWVRDHEAIGLIRPLVDLAPNDAATALAATVQHELARILSRQGSASCSIGLEVYAPHRDMVAPAGPDQSPRIGMAGTVGRQTAKRVLDAVGSSLFLTLLAPVLLLIAGVIKLTSKGPVMFRQERVGEGGRSFTMLKFRTMQVNADPKIHQQYVTQFIQSGASANAGPHKVFKIVDDPRITPIGHFLRRTSLDELPQFWNVLRGDMSLVGPRPPLPYEVARYKRWHCRRLTEAKPGITGLWQVTGRSRTTFDEMVRLDLQYARSHSLWTDIKILLATPRAVLSGTGAH